MITQSIGEATHLLLPFQYECIFGTREQALNSYKVLSEDFDDYIAISKKYDKLSQETGKKLLVFFYHDSSDPLPFANAIIFRTSWLRSRQTDHVFGMPAFVDSLPGIKDQLYLPWQHIPKIGFMGQTAAMKLPVSIAVRIWFNRCCKKLGIPIQVKVWHLPNYLLRRQLIKICEGSKHLQAEMVITDHQNAYLHSNKEAYLHLLAYTPYILCVAGWGNYSYRFYETLRAGRIPVFVDTDCLLPCADKIDWQQLMVWVEQDDVTKIADKLQQYHRQLSPAEFEQKQDELRAIYLQYLTPQGFGSYLLDFLSTN